MCFCSAENLSSFVDLLVPTAVPGGIRIRGSRLQPPFSVKGLSAALSNTQPVSWYGLEVLIAESFLSTLSCALLVCGGSLLLVAGRRPGRDSSTGLRPPFTVKGMSSIIQSRSPLSWYGLEIFVRCEFFQPVLA